MPKDSIRFRLWAAAHKRISLSLQPEGRRPFGLTWPESVVLSEAQSQILFPPILAGIGPVRYRGLNGIRCRVRDLDRVGPGSD